jgi:hypothetical protein
LPELVSSPLNAGKIAYADVNVNTRVAGFCDENSLQNTARRAVFSARCNRRPFCVVSDWLKSAPEFSVKIEAKASVSRQSDV